MPRLLRLFLYKVLVISSREVEQDLGCISVLVPLVELSALMWTKTDPAGNFALLLFEIKITD